MDMHSKKHLFFVAVWEKEQLNDFVEISLPTLILDKNLGLLDKKDSNYLIILTDKFGKNGIEKSNVYHHLDKKIIINFWVFDRPINYIVNEKKKILNFFQDKLLQVIDQYQYVHFLYPEFIYGNGTFDEIFKRLDEGYSGFLLPIPSINKFNFKIFLDQTFKKSFDNKLNQLNRICQNKSFVKIANNLLTDFQKSFFQDEKHDVQSPSTLMWKIKNLQEEQIDCSILFKEFFLQPISLKVQGNNSKMIRDFRVSLNNEYISNLYSDIDDLWCAQNTNQAIICKLDKEYDFTKLKLNDYDKTLRISRFVERNSNIIHRQFIKKNYLWLTGQTDKNKLKEVFLIANKLIEKLNFRLLISDNILRQNDIASYKQRLLGQKLNKVSYFTKQGMPSFIYSWKKRELLIALVVFQIYSILHFLKLLEYLRIIRHKYEEQIKVLKNNPKLFEKFRVFARLYVSNENSDMNIRMYDFWLHLLIKFRILAFLEEVLMIKIFIGIFKDDKKPIKYFKIPPIFKVNK